MEKSKSEEPGEIYEAFLLIKRTPLNIFYLLRSIIYKIIFITSWIFILLGLPITALFIYLRVALGLYYCPYNDNGNYYFQIFKMPKKCKNKIVRFVINFLLIMYFSIYFLEIFIHCIAIFNFPSFSSSGYIFLNELTAIPIEDFYFPPSSEYIGLNPIFVAISLCISLTILVSMLRYLLKISLENYYSNSLYDLI